VISHLGLTDRDQEDHPKYGPLSLANVWAGIATFSAGHISAAGRIPGGTLPAFSHLRLGSSSAYNNFSALRAELGGTLTLPTNTIAGVSGQAYATASPTVSAFGLFFASGMFNYDTASVMTFNARLFAFGAGRTLTAAYSLYVSDPSLIFASLPVLYGLYLSPLTKGTARRPIYDASPPASGHHNLLASTLQLFSTTVAFGGGVGVLGVANATTTPTSTPAGGGVLYASGGALRWRGSAGTDTLVAAA
jgi:hypothetical protein